MTTTKRFPINPAHPERLCWGCDSYCRADAMNCGNGSERTQHPAELFGEDWAQWGLDPFAAQATIPDQAPLSETRAPTGATAAAAKLVTAPTAPADAATLAEPAAGR